MIPGHPQPDELVLDEPTRRLCAAVASGEAAPVRLAVVAPGGYGKSALLDLLAAGPEAARFRRGIRPDGGLLLVDDAHLLGDAALAEVADLALDDRVGLVVAARPRPRPAGLAAVLGRLRGQVVLRPFDRARLRECLTAAAGRAFPDEVVDFALATTAGIPGLVHRLAPHLRPDTTTVPPGALEEFRFDVDRLTPDATRVLVALAAGVPADLLAGLLTGPAGEAVAEARASGFLTADGSLPPLAAAALRELVPAEQRAAVLGALADQRLQRGGAMVDLAGALLAAGTSGDRAGAVYAAAAEQADPALAVRLHEAAAEAGHPVDEVRRAEAEALSGALDPALRRADAVMATATGERRAAAANVAAAALAHRGQLARSAELYQWAGSGALAAVGLLAVGRADDAEKALSANDTTAPPTLLAGAVHSAARGVLASVRTADPAALATVVRAAEMLEPVGHDALLPDSPAALGALLALHTGAAGIADSLLERALAARVGGALLEPRHRLLRSWSSLLRGEEPVLPPGDLAPRDWLFAVGLAVGAARRGTDLSTLRRTWEQAHDAVVRHPVDLFSLLPLGEFAVAAARVGDRERFAPHLAQAWDLLRDLGDPPVWSTALHWSCLHAEIIAERPDAADEHVGALAAAPGPFASALAEAAQCWRRVLRGEVDAERVDAAARGLHAVGLCWDGARLAGQAAIRTSDRKAMVSLLDCARVLQGQGSVTPQQEESSERVGARLSERELQVATLVVDGLTYKQIGDRLFISAKTVEHHMARMRARLGATSRSDLLAQLRVALDRG
ncbi:helix-turn-helix domain-containing protein [Actinokineospora bangkokensis]|uniref:Helix-turn-helix transcriptional regulator n=1 Tax=Actinokineospora bangkokensis TaxID=1193682 RepID=A0A1Q9LH38_9PSEU|nr:helix-turn-helix transcriptional regulator [Actinokineospora bangkokensis]OLR91330.1 helix-turn-helix transcriptional regulator [Actinokineospora bangkokensis]